MKLKLSKRTFLFIFLGVVLGFAINVAISLVLPFTNLGYYDDLLSAGQTGRYEELRKTSVQVRDKTTDRMLQLAAVRLIRVCEEAAKKKVEIFQPSNPFEAVKLVWVEDAAWDRTERFEDPFAAKRGGLSVARVFLFVLAGCLVPMGDALIRHRRESAAHALEEQQQEA